MIALQDEKKIIGLLLFMVPFAIVNSYMLNVALPSISKEFDLLPSTTSWLVTIAGIISAMGSVIYGKLADLYGVKKIALFGVVFFFGGSLLCFFAPNFTLLLIGRIIQGIGISTIPSLAMTIPAKYIVEERRGNALGTLASAMAFGAIIGPVLGGLLTGLNWRFLFLFPFILLFTIPFIWKWLPNETAKQKDKIDFLSLGLLMGSVISLMEAITFMKISLLIISLIFFLLFVWRQRKVQNPFVPFTLFRRTAYVQGVLMGVINTAMNFGVFLITPLLLSQYFGLSGYKIGLVLTPAAVAAALMGKFGGKLTDHLGSRYVLSISIFLLGIGFFMLSSFSGYQAWLLSILLILTEIGYIFMQPTISKTISTHLPKEHTGIGMGMFGLLNFLTIAISGTLLTKFIEFKHIPPLNPFSNTDLSGIYSNIYLFFFVLTIVNLIFMFLLTKMNKGVYTK